MELKYSKSTFGKKNLHKEHVIGIPITSIYTPKLAISPDSAAQYQLMPSPSINTYSRIRHSKGDSVIAKVVKLGQNLDIFAQGIREHVRLGPKLSETVKGKLSLGARILQIGGLDKVFKKNFNTKEDEKLLKALQCYLSTTAGPIAGLLFISNYRIAFCSDRSIKISSATGKLQKLHYKIDLFRNLNVASDKSQIPKYGLHLERKAKEAYTMELQYNNLRFEKKKLHKEHVIGIPTSSIYTWNSAELAILPDPAAQYRQLLPSSIDSYSKIRHSRGVSVIAKMIKLGQNMDLFAQGIREHLRLGSKLSETLKGKLSLGARILQVGGMEKVFKQNFNIRDDEKLLKASQCYLSTTVGAIAGLLFVSNNKVAFCSERSIKISSATGKLLKLHYKVMIPLGQIKRANESENVKKPTQKYVQLVTEDNFDFWFMGFLNHQKTLKYLQQAIPQAR
ncbi:hypothetical protein RD792_015222 [Penstemon davidsonii]|uniref:GRAM domain-containing protein n=1 Tax=Penstemon davidsonii TaxID=160366 RepID=A0ABR0CRL1_9LAMI|nr:hypothetical protein RD792_015222 [Penstemon davidsonii]